MTNKSEIMETLSIGDNFQFSFKHWIKISAKICDPWKKISTKVTAFYEEQESTIGNVT